MHEEELSFLQRAELKTFWSIFFKEKSVSKIKFRSEKGAGHPKQRRTEQVRCNVMDALSIVYR
jgi:hypothetical protein